MASPSRKETGAAPDGGAGAGLLAKPDRVADHLNNRIFFRLFQVANTLQKQAVKELGVTTVQWAVLGALSDPRPTYGMSVGTLADFLVVSRQNLDGVLKRLERDGLVERVTDPGHKRARNDMVGQIDEFRVWKVQRFSWWVTQLMHRSDADNDFDRRRQLAELDYLSTSEAAELTFAVQRKIEPDLPRKPQRISAKAMMPVGAAGYVTNWITLSWKSLPRAPCAAMGMIEPPAPHSAAIMNPAMVASAE